MTGRFPSHKGVPKVHHNPNLDFCKIFLPLIRPESDDAALRPVQLRVACGKRVRTVHTCSQSIDRPIESLEGFQPYNVQATASLFEAAKILQPPQAPGLRFICQSLTVRASISDAVKFSRKAMRSSWRG